MRKINKRCLCLVLGTMLSLVLVAQSQAIDSTSTLDTDAGVPLPDEKQEKVNPDDIFKEKDPVTVESKKTESALTTKKTEDEFSPDGSFSDITLHEGVAETVKISNNVINWISATEDIVGIRYDKKVQNLVADYDGKNCYLRYSGKKTLAYIMTENAVYPTWIVPSDITAVHIKLKKKNPLVSENDSSPMTNQKGSTYSNNKETKLIEMVKFAYMDETKPIKVAKLQKVKAIDGIRGYRYKSIKFEDGMYVETYLFKLAPNSANETLAIKETDFLLPELCYYPIGVAIEHPELRKDRYTRVFVIGAEKPEGEEK